MFHRYQFEMKCDRIATRVFTLLVGKAWDKTRENQNFPLFSLFDPHAQDTLMQDEIFFWSALSSRGRN